MINSAMRIGTTSSWKQEQIDKHWTLWNLTMEIKVRQTICIACKHEIAFVDEGQTNTINTVHWMVLLFDGRRRSHRYNGTVDH